MTLYTYMARDFNCGFLFKKTKIIKENILKLGKQLEFPFMRLRLWK